MGALWIRVLGPLEVMTGGTAVPPSAAKHRIVLECLALRANAVVTADFLIEALWADHPPAKPGPQLQVYVANLRHALEPDRPKGAAPQRLVSRPGGYLLAVGEQELDLLQFRQHIAAGELAVQGGDLAAGAESLRHAVELYKVPAFPDLTDIELFRPELDALQETWLDVYQDLADVELALGRHNPLAGELQSLVAQYPYREDLWAPLVLALYRCDRQADALAACRKMRRIFIDELGLDPGPRFQELEGMVRRQDASLAAPALNGRGAGQRVDNLPAQLTPLIGREAELKEICSLCLTEGCRLVTVTGPGGTGKTSLALAAAGQLRTRMPDGVCWVNLASLSETRQVPATIAAALGVEDRAGADLLEAVTRFLRSRRLLLVLDNFEHLEDAWHIVVDMLTVAPLLRILVTSRRPLQVRAEYEYELTPLALPPLGSPLSTHLLQEVPAVKLFLARGRTVRPLFKLDSTNEAAVTRICYRLDGLPLAIELAAAQLRNRTLQALLAGLEASLTDLPAAFRDLPDRQRTLAATIDWSHQLLHPPERELFDRLGVFAADPSVAAVHCILGHASDLNGTEALLTALSQHSLLRTYTDETGTRRVSMLQVIREFARDRLSLLDEAETIRMKHAIFYLGVAEDIGPQLWGAKQVDAFRLLQADAAELRRALRWATGPRRSTDVGLRLIGELWHYWELTEDVGEQYEIAIELLQDTPDAPPHLRAPALSGTATLCWVLGRNDEATELHHRALTAFNSAGNSQGAAWTTICLAVQALVADDPDTARSLAEETLSMPDASLRTRVATQVVLSLQAMYAGDSSRALDLCKESVELARPLGDRLILGVVLTNLAECMEQTGDLATAETLLREALGATLELGAQANIVAFLESLASIYIQQSRMELAIRVLAATEVYRSDRSHPLSPPEQRRLESLITTARTQAGPIRFGLIWAEGQALTITQAVREILDANQDKILEEHSSAAIPDQATETPVEAAPWA
ncbi:BTAD domain-containing putative transcriptional regulator [Arthrobacter sp. TMN-37]